MLHRLVLKVTKFQLSPPKRLSTFHGVHDPPPMSNRVNYCQTFITWSLWIIVADIRSLWNRYLVGESLRLNESTILGPKGARSCFAGKENDDLKTYLRSYEICSIVGFKAEQPSQPRLLCNFEEIIWTFLSMQSWCIVDICIRPPTCDIECVGSFIITLSLVSI